MLRFADRQFYSVDIFSSLLNDYEDFYSRIGGQQHPGVVIIEHGIL